MNESEKNKITMMSEDETNTGYWNLGDWNTGIHNAGDFNAGDSNIGDFNTGDGNTGNRNSGDHNSGNYNSGKFNSGNHNCGCWNSGNRNIGYFNTNSDECYVRIFNKIVDINIRDIKVPDFCVLDLTIWIDEKDMTDKEKKIHPCYIKHGGYLKGYTYKEAWMISWNKAKDWDKVRILNLPNFNNALFLEITGIDVHKELKCKQ